MGEGTGVIVELTLRAKVNVKIIKNHNLTLKLQIPACLKYLYLQKEGMYKIVGQLVLKNILFYLKSSYILNAKFQRILILIIKHQSIVIKVFITSGSGLDFIRLQSDKLYVYIT